MLIIKYLIFLSYQSEENPIYTKFSIGPQLAYINFISFPARKFIEKYFIKNQS